MNKYSIRLSIANKCNWQSSVCDRHKSIPNHFNALMGIPIWSRQKAMVNMLMVKSVRYEFDIRYKISENISKNCIILHARILSKMEQRCSISSRVSTISI